MKNTFTLKINSENSKIKDIWIYGYHFDKINELANTSFLEAALELTKDNNVKVNGMKNNALKKILKR